jgi:hypothetical protein
LQAEKLKVLTGILGDYRRSGGEFLFYCPRCKHHKLKLSINIQKDCYKCWVCDYSGIGVRRLVRRHGDFNDRKKWSEFDATFELTDLEKLLEGQEQKEHKVALPEGFQSLTVPNRSIASTKVRNYLARRGISDIDIVNWKIGYCAEGEFEGRVVIPSFNNDGYVNFFVARAYIDHWRKYMNPRVSRNEIIFNELFLDFTEDLIIVEGAFDAIKAGTNSVPLLGSTLSRKSKLLKQIVKNDTSVYLALDSDAENKAYSIITELIQYGIDVYKVDTSGYEDVGAMAKQEFSDRKEKAIKIDSENYLTYQLSRV